MISVVKWPRFEGKSSCLYQDTNKYLAVGPEKNTTAFVRETDSGLLVNVGNQMTQTTRQPDSVWPTSRPISHWPLDRQIQSGQHPDPSVTDHSTARFSMANIRTHPKLTTWQPNSVWPHIRTHLKMTTWQPGSC